MNVPPNSVSEPTGYDLILSLVQTLIALAQFACVAISTFIPEAFNPFRSSPWDYDNVTVKTLSTILFTASAIVILCPTVRDAIRRRTHHLFPDSFTHDPPQGPRHTPGYLLTDGLTRTHISIPPHKGECTFRQLQNHTVDVAGYNVSLVPTIAEALAGVHPGSGIQVNVPARSTAVETIQRELQEAINDGTSEASSTLNLIQSVNHRLTCLIRPNLIPIRPQPGVALSTVMLSHPFAKELSIALQNVLALPANKYKLRALYYICRDQHVKILEAELRNRDNLRRRLIHQHGAAAVNAHWIHVPH